MRILKTLLNCTLHLSLNFFCLDICFYQEMQHLMMFHTLG